MTRAPLWSPAHHIALLGSPSARDRQHVVQHSQASPKPNCQYTTFPAMAKTKWWNRVSGADFNRSKLHKDQALLNASFLPQGSMQVEVNEQMLSPVNAKGRVNWKEAHQVLGIPHLWASPYDPENLHLAMNRVVRKTTTVKSLVKVLRHEEKAWLHHIRGRKSHFIQLITAFTKVWCSHHQLLSSFVPALSFWLIFPVHLLLLVHFY